MCTDRLTEEVVKKLVPWIVPAEVDRRRAGTGNLTKLAVKKLVPWTVPAEADLLPLFAASRVANSSG